MPYHREETLIYRRPLASRKKETSELKVDKKTISPYPNRAMAAWRG
ncbi:MAG: hypothetical protein H6Q93_1087 [Nitrospirae bacterium]|nr:hypothetical protein [Nitrospirota bacterium]